MAEEIRLTLSFAVACGAALLLTPAAIRLAGRTGFYDHPVGYKAHVAPTPYLGGVAVVAGMLIAGLLFGGGEGAVVAIALGAIAVHLLGTVDDRRNLGPWVRISLVILVAAGLYAAGVGWSVFASEGLNLALTIVFVLGVVNAYNLMDNLDGATGAVSAASGVALGSLAVVEGEAALAALAFAMAGACAGFLRFNLAKPARIFLGDGGSMPLGFAVAGIIMALPYSGSPGWTLVPVAVVLVGLPALDTTLVVVSRIRRRIGVLTGGRDHLTHRLLSRLGTPRRVAAVLGATQIALCGAGSVLFELAASTAVLGSIGLIIFGMIAVVVLESPGWAPRSEEESV